MDTAHAMNSSRRLPHFALHALVIVVMAIAATTLPAADAQAQGPMTNGADHLGSISAPGELDQWTFTATQGDAITLAVGETGVDTPFYPWIRLQAPNGTQVGNSYGSVAAQVSIYAPQSGTYTVIIASNDSGFNDTGDYRLTLSHNPGAFVVSGGDQGGAMTNGAHHEGSIRPGDLDLWTFDAVQGAAITLRIGELGTDSQFYPWLRLRGPNGQELDNAYGDLAAEVSVYAPTTGTYTVVVASNDSGYDATGDYRLTLALTPGDFVVPAGDQGGPMTVGANHAGAIYRGDLDLYSFNAVQGAAITIRIGEVGDDTPFYPWLRLRGPNGTQIDGAYGALAAEVSVYAPSTGTYTVVVASNDSGYDATGDYQLTLALTPGGPITVPTGDQGGPLVNGANHAGFIHRGDIDMYTVEAVQGAALTLRIGEVGDDTPFYPWLRLRGPNGAELDNAYGALAAEVSIYAPSTGTYTVLVTSNDSGYDATGNYLLTMSLTPGGNIAVPTGDEGGAMTNGVNHAGAIHRGDLDQWSFTAVQGATITARIGEVGDDSPFYPWLRLRGPNGTELDSAYGDLAAEVSIVAPSTGTYTLLVASNDSGYDATGNYLVTLALTPGDFLVPTGDQGGTMTQNAFDYDGVIHRGDLDQWRFSAVQGTALTVSIGEVGNDSPFYPWIRLRAPNGTTIDSSYGSVAALMQLTAPQTGLYTVIVASNDSGYDATGVYRIRATGISDPQPPGGANLQITKAGALVGDTLTYTLTATNAGPAAATGVTITDTLPAGLMFVSCTASDGGACGGAGSARTATYVSMPVGATRTVTIVTTKAAGVMNIQNSASITANESDPFPSNNIATHVLTNQVDDDNDTMPNDWETTYGLDPASSAGEQGSNGDPDGDGIINSQEFANGTHPRGFFTRFLAEGASNNFFDVRLALLNVGLTPARLLRRYLQPNGMPIAQFEILQPGQRRTLTKADLGGLTSPEFSTVVESDQPIVLDRTMTWGGGYGSHAEGGVPNPATTWYLAEGSTSGDFALFYLLQNPNETATLATVKYLLPFGQPPLVREYPLAARSRLTIPVDDQGGVLAGTDVSAVITTPIPIIVERAMYKSTPTQIFAAGHGSAGVTTPATTWFLAEGATGPFFDCFILLANPNDAPATATIDYLLSDGTTQTKSYVVPANGRVTIWVDDEQIPAGSGIRPLDNVAVSSSVTSDLPIIVERTMWWPSPAISANYWTEAHNSPGATTTGTKWALAEGEVGGSDATETYILIANTSAFAGTAHVTLYFEDASSVQRDFVLPARSRITVNASGDFPQSVNRRFGAVVESVGDPAAQIVVERAMYTSPGGVTWTAGTNALAARIK
jgi:uncharacterized repeat protein (TIGR01451 family)